GSAAAFTRTLSVPGAAPVPAAHVTMVGVLPTHRRQRVLTRLMHRQLRDVQDAGEPVAVLWASEGRIYHRFGYGLATTRLLLEADPGRCAPRPRAPPGAGRLRDALPADVRKDLIEVHERGQPTRPGWSGRNERWWDRLLGDPPPLRRGAGPRRALLFEGA